MHCFVNKKEEKRFRTWKFQLSEKKKMKNSIQELNSSLSTKTLSPPNCRRSKQSKEDFTLTFFHNGPKFNELDPVKKARRFCFYDQTFPFLRSNVSVSTIKRFRFYDQTFPFLRSNVSFSTIKRFLYIVITLVFLR